MKRAALLAVGPAALVTYATRIEPHWLETVTLPMPLPGLPAELAGCRLVQISDLHIGPIVSDDYLRDVFQQVETLQPDILVITGDILHFGDLQHIARAERLLERLPSGRLGSFMVTGNHDFGPGWNKATVADSICRVMQNLGITPLRNESVDVSGLRIAGVDDFWSPHCRLDEALAGLFDGPASVVLCHNPDAVDDPAFNGYRGWILSGHTHGGQVNLLGRRPFAPIRNPHYAAGHVELAPGRHLYVNRAIGYTPRVRFCARPEITVFELQPPA